VLASITSFTTGFVQSWGYLAVFTVVALESLGIPLPGETTLIIAALLAAAGTLQIAGVIIAGALGAIIGDNIGFAIGWWGGYRLLVRYGRYVHLDQAGVKVARHIFRRHGGKVVFFGRFVSILRAYAAFLAGTSRMRWPAFLAFNASGGIIWATGWGLAAYSAGSALQRVTLPVDIALGVAAVAVMVAGFLLLRRQAGRLEALAELEFPGPLEGYPGGPHL
jgi:membrane protein DedA with SNARE-associated domain